MDCLALQLTVRRCGMKKKFSALMALIIACAALAITAAAEESYEYDLYTDITGEAVYDGTEALYDRSSSDGFADEYYRVIDMAGLLGYEESEELLAKLDEVSVRQKFDLIVVTTDSIDGKTPEAFADDVYDECKFGYGENHDGALLLISMEDRDWYISTCGYGLTALTDYGIQRVGDAMLSDLSSGDYAAAFDTFADECDRLVTRARNGNPLDIDSDDNSDDTEPGGPPSILWLFISLGIGFIVALIVVAVMKSKLRTVRSQAAADSYVKNDSMQLTAQNDIFLYRNVSRTERPRDNDNSGGGSSSHTSSSGATHGGGGGKF